MKLSVDAPGFEVNQRPTEVYFPHGPENLPTGNIVVVAVNSLGTFNRNLHFVSNSVKLVIMNTPQAFATEKVFEVKEELIEHSNAPAIFKMHANSVIEDKWECVQKRGSGFPWQRLDHECH